jgi:hypothetical protein
MSAIDPKLTSSTAKIMSRCRHKGKKSFVSLGGSDQEDSNYARMFACRHGRFWHKADEIAGRRDVSFSPKADIAASGSPRPKWGVTRFAEPALAGWWIVRSSDKKYLIVEVEPTDKPRTVHCASHNSP